jgi:curved DNA-binding protein CbpA
MKTHTHYDNLKVTRNAPFEVIRAAYKSLSQKYHPDKYLNNVDAIRVMSLINASYEVLSDPIKRQVHDDWIKKQESVPELESHLNLKPSLNPAPSLHSQRATKFTTGVLKFSKRFFAIYLLLAATGLYLIFDGENTIKSNSKPYSSDPETDARLVSQSKAISKYDEVVDQVINDGKPNLNSATVEKKKPTTQQTKGLFDDLPASSSSGQAKEIKSLQPVLNFDPLGNPWPAKSGYIKGVRSRKISGLSNITIDNSSNDNDVHVKLTDLNGTTAFPIRQVFIRARDSFKLAKVTAGNYDIRYRNLSTGQISGSEPFRLTEVKTETGREFSNLTITLYKVQNGNMRTHSLTEASKILCVPMIDESGCFHNEIGHCHSHQKMHKVY